MRPSACEPLAREALDPAELGWLLTIRRALDMISKEDFNGRAALRPSEQLPGVEARMDRSAEKRELVDRLSSEASSGWCCRMQVSSSGANGARSGGMYGCAAFGRAAMATSLIDGSVRSKQRDSVEMAGVPSAGVATPEGAVSVDAQPS